MRWAILCNDRTWYRAIKARTIITITIRTSTNEPKLEMTSFGKLNVSYLGFINQWTSFNYRIAPLPFDCLCSFFVGPLPVCGIAALSLSLSLRTTAILITKTSTFLLNYERGRSLIYKHICDTHHAANKSINMTWTCLIQSSLKLPIGRRIAPLANYSVYCLFSHW